MKVERNKILANAQKAIQRGDLAGAVKEYELLLEAQPKDVQSLLRLAGLYLRVNRADDAVKSYINAGEQYASTGFYQKAVAAYKQALQLRDKDPQLLRQLGILYQQMGLKSPAVEHLIQSSSLSAHKGDFRSAIEVMLTVLDLEPDRPDLKARYGEYLFQAGRKDEAVAVFRGLVEILKLEGQWEDLARFYERILQLSPNDHDIGLDLARTYLRLGLAPKSLQRLKQLFDDGVRDAEVFDLLARSYVLLGKNAKAVGAYLEKVRRMNPRSHAEEIQKTYRRILEIDPTNEHALTALGEAEEEAEAVSISEAIPAAETQTVVEVVPLEEEPVLQASSAPGQATGEFSEILQEASVYIRYGIKEKALKKLEQILAADPNNVAALKKRAELYRESDARRAIPDLVRLSEIYEGLGDLDAADRAIEDAKSIDPTHPDVRAFLGLDAVDAAGGDGMVGEVEVSAEAADVYPDAEEFLRAAADESDEETAAAVEVTAVGLDDTLVDSDNFGDVEVEVELEAEAPPAPPPPAAAPARRAAPPPEPETPPYQDELDQVTFFLDTGLIDEARSLLDEVTARFGARAEFAALRARIPQDEPPPPPVKPAAPARAPAKAAPPPPAAAAPTPPPAVAAPDVAGASGGIFDLAKELEEELDFATIEEASPGAEDVPTFEEIFDAFKKGVKEQLSDHDADAHYDLGIAYMEMGIIDEAVSEFNLAKNSQHKAGDACNMIGVALTRKGDLPGAAAAYEEGLRLPNLGDAILLNMHYEVAMVQEQLGDLKGALVHLKEVLARDKNYREVGAVLKRIREQIETLKAGGGPAKSGAEKPNVTYF